MNNNWILVFFFAVFLIFEFFINKKQLLAPSFVVTGVMLLTASILAINTDYWRYVIGLNTCLTIIFSVIIFSLGYHLAYFLCVSGGREKSKSKPLVLPTPSKNTYAWVALLSFLFFVVFFIIQYINAASVGMSSTISDIVKANRWNVEAKRFEIFEKIVFLIHRVLVYIFIFIFVSNKTNSKSKTNSHGFLTILIVLFYFGSCAMSSNRSDLVAFFAFLLFSIIFCRQRNKISKSANENSSFKTLLTIAFIFVIALLAFRLLGYLTGKSLESAYDNISTYIGSSFISFDKYLNGTGYPFPDGDDPLLFRGIYSILNMFGLNIDSHSFYKPSQYWGPTGKNWHANVYSSLLEYHMKFGMAGLLLFEFAIGAFFGVVWKRIMTKRSSLLFIFIYADLFFYYLCMYSIDERLFSQFFTLTSFLEIIVINVSLNTLCERGFRKNRPASAFARTTK